METYTTHSMEETVALGREFAQRLGVGDCVALSGQLGAGKTQFARGVAVGLGLADGRMVSSPTFVLMQEYPARMPVYHQDSYRLYDPTVELIELGFEEMLGSGVVVLEWAERAPEGLPPGGWRVDIEIAGVESRTIRIARLP
jgi:tRNA threonylcarbamoyladenosine biosynthesis protein TsaE